MIHVDYSDIVNADPRAISDAEVDENFVTSLSDRAVRLLYQLVPGLDSRIETGKLDEEVAKDKVIEAVLRVVRNPDPIYSSETELGYSYTINKRLASGSLWYPDDDLRLLRGPRGKIGTIPLGLGPGWCRP